MKLIFCSFIFMAVSVLSACSNETAISETDTKENPIDTETPLESSAEISQDETTQKELNEHLKEEATEIDFIKANGNEIEKGTLVKASGTVGTIDPNGLRGGDFALTTEEDEGLGMYDILNLNTEEIPLKEGQEVTIFGSYNDKDELGMPQIVATIIEESAAGEESEDAPLATHSTPLPLGETFTVKSTIYNKQADTYATSLDLTVTEVTRGQKAWDILYTGNQYNEPAAEGYEYVLIKLRATVKDAETKDYPFQLSSFDFQFFDQEGAAYERSPVVVPNKLDAELYDGATTEGYITNQVRIGDQAKLTYRPAYSEPIFFKLN